MGSVPGSGPGTESYRKGRFWLFWGYWYPTRGCQNHSDTKFELPAPETPIQYFLGSRSSVQVVLPDRTVSGAVPADYRIGPVEPPERIFGTQKSMGWGFWERRIRICCQNDSGTPRWRAKSLRKSCFANKSPFRGAIPERRPDSSSAQNLGPMCQNLGAPGIFTLRKWLNVVVFFWKNPNG